MHKLLILIPALLLGACGGGGSDHTSSEDRTPSIPAGSVSGIVFDSRAYNITVAVLDERGAALATSRTNGHGDYRASLQADSQPITISVTEGVYLENASLMPVNLDGDAGLALRAVDFYQAGDDPNLSVTFFSTLATGLTEYLVQQDLSTEVAIERAYAEIDAWAGFNTRRTRPVAVFDAVNASEILTDSIKAGFVAAGISELTRIVGIDTGTGEHIAYTSIGFIQVAYEDIKADGVLDGVGNGGNPLSYGTLPITGDTYRTLLATRLLQFANSTNNKTGLAFNDLVDYASHVNLYAGELFNYTTSPDIQDTYPTVRQFRPADGALVSGSFDATALVSDQFGLRSVRYYMDDRFAATAGYPYIPIRSIDTLNYTNGQHAFRIDVENLFGNITSVTHTVTINN